MSLKPGPDSEFYDPHSADSMLTRIIAKLDVIEQQLEEMKAERAEVRERLANIDQDRWYQRGVVAAIAAAIGVAVAAVQNWLGKN